MELIKCASRAARTVCDYCGMGGVNRDESDQLYWGHDLDMSGSARFCQRCGCERSFVLLNPDGSAHDCRGRIAAKYGTPEPAVMGASAPKRFGFGPATASAGTAEADPEPAFTEAEPVRVSPGLVAAPKGAAERVDMLNALLELMAPKVDEDQVRGILHNELGGVIKNAIATLDAKIAELKLPTVVKVERPAGSVKQIDGSHERLPVILKIIGARKHVLMVGPAGTGKSTIADQAADALGLAYFSISLSPQTPASSILGYMQAAGEYVRSLYREAYEKGGVFHFDEFDNAHPSVLAVINASLANGQMAFPDRMVKRHPDFVCVASANTYGRGADRAYVGRQAIDAATLDRFVVVAVEVDNALEESMCRATGADSETVSQVLRYVRALRRNAASHKMPLVFSPRASEGCCTLLAVGLTWSEVCDMRVRRGISDQDWSKVTSGVSDPGL